MTQRSQWPRDNDSKVTLLRNNDSAGIIVASNDDTCSFRVSPLALLSRDHSEFLNNKTRERGKFEMMKNRKEKTERESYL